MDDGEEPAEAPQRSRHLPEVWTRVVSVFEDYPQHIKAHKTSIDLQIAAGIEPMPMEEGEEPW